jgi:hypothetical protein
MVPSTPIIRPFSDSYLLGYSDEHVFYEIDHFFWLAQLLGGGTIALGASSPADITRLNTARTNNVAHRKHRSRFCRRAVPIPTFWNADPSAVPVSKLRCNLEALFGPRFKARGRKVGKLASLKLLAV